MASQKILILGLGIINLICSSNYITANDSISIVENITSNSKCTITQSAVLSSRLNKAIEITDVSHDNAVEKQYISGYRIQIFSDNNSRTAKNEAKSKSLLISEKFPELRTYITYNAPFWRLRVGDFRTLEEANDIVVKLKEEFPKFSKEIRVVRDRINYIDKE
ncbi:MAG: SPOR domain-containing protein [Muribaculaceae bacterium]|nr:SPOR domain-containing protein [Muribaculaceae bacterium]